MRVGLLGAGAIGATLTRRLSRAGHQVKVANSRAPETIDEGILLHGATAVWAHEVVMDVDVLITSVLFSRMRQIAVLMRGLPSSATIIDTSNYYPHRDGNVPALDAGQVESVWVAEQFGRPVAKAWNAITAESLAYKAEPSGTLGRIAVPVAADQDHGLAVAAELVEETGLDAVIAGSLAESWRQQPGTPAYCTDLTRQELLLALDAAEKDRAPVRRDLVSKIIAERMNDGMITGPALGDYIVRVNRAVYL